MLNFFQIEPKWGVFLRTLAMEEKEVEERGGSVLAFQVGFNSSKMIIMMGFDVDTIMY